MQDATTTTQQGTGHIEPPWITSPGDFEPNDDFDKPKKRPKVEKAAAIFRKYFEHEDWFVRLMIPPDSKSYIVLVADARYYPTPEHGKPIKYRKFMGWPVTVAKLQGFEADKERQFMQAPPPAPDPVEGKKHLLNEACSRLLEQYSKQPWFLDIDWHMRQDGSTFIQLHVAGSHYKGPLSLPKFEWKGLVSDLILVVVPYSITGGDDPLGVK